MSKEKYAIMNGICDYCGLKEEMWIHLRHAEPEKLTGEANTALKIYDDVTDRRGIKQEFYQVDEDVTQEILETWAKIIKGKPGLAKEQL